MQELYVGQVFKNYKALCNYLQEDVKEGNAKIHQRAYLETFFKLEQNGHKLTIIEIYKEYKPKLETIRYSENYPIMVNLLDELHKSYSGVKVSKTLPKQYTEIIIYTNELCQLLGFCQRGFFDLKEGKKDVEFTRDEQRRVFNAGNTMFRDKIRNTLTTLANHNFIVAQKTYVVITKERESLDVATMEEHNTIEVLKAEALGELHRELHAEGRIKSLYGKFTEGDCHNMRVEDRFYAKLDFKLLEKTNIVKSYAVHRILFTESMLNRMQDFKLTFIDKLKLTDSINTDVHSKLSSKLDESLKELLDITIKLPTEETP